MKRFESIDEVKIGDVVKYDPPPSNPWTIHEAIGAIGRVTGKHFSCAIVRLDRGGHITAYFENLVHAGKEGGL